MYHPFRYPVRFIAGCAVVSLPREVDFVVVDDVLRWSADLREKSAIARARSAWTIAKSRRLVTESAWTRRAMDNHAARQSDTDQAASPDGPETAK